MSSKRPLVENPEILVDKLQRENEALRKALRVANEKLSAVLNGSNIKIWQLDVPSQALQVFNAPWGALLGYQPDEVEATVEGWKSNLHPDDKDTVIAAFETHIRGESDAFQVVHRMMRKDGSVSWISDRGKVIEFDNEGRPLRMMGAHVDITQEKLYEQRLSSLVNIDPLTGLLNRPALIEKYAQLNLSHGQQAALLFLDLDNFKYVNDHYGHKFGDLVLCYIAGILKKASPDKASVGRFGGDEFVILYGSGDQAELKRICQNLLAPFQKPLVLDNMTLDIGLSIGVCVFDSISDNFTDVCQKADQAMYQVKKAGKNNVAFWDFCAAD
jgi:diguanylate cyclase (GGDEF)-like protein/PAS domain S-box-containing protein